MSGFKKIFGLIKQQIVSRLKLADIIAGLIVNFVAAAVVAMIHFILSVNW
jgi:hypothetical protein